MKIVKNKHAPPFRTAQFELEFGKGICREVELIELGVKHKYITKNGAFYRMNDKSFHGKDAMKNYLASNIDAREDLALSLGQKLKAHQNVRTESCSETDENEVVLTCTNKCG